jgi:hypothetical protein
MVGSAWRSRKTSEEEGAEISLSLQENTTEDLKTSLEALPSKGVLSSLNSTKRGQSLTQE